MPTIEVAAFYKFAHLPQFASLRAPLQALCDGHAAKGILLIAAEGINATIAATPEAMAGVLAGIRAIAGLEGIEHKTSHAQTMPFLRMKVRLKREIVTLGVPADPLAKAGTYVEPQDWNALIARPDLLVLDTRNSYEVRIGTFQNAIDPQTASFSQFPDYVRDNLDPARHKRIAMFCTGGIRCEKASSYLLARGFGEVFHLKGGILKYLESVPQAESRWDGACFVFDRRVAVTHGLELARIDLCRGCRSPLQPQDHAAPGYEEGVSCRHCAGSMSQEHKASARERQRQVRLAQARGTVHLGPASHDDHFT